MWTIVCLLFFMFLTFVLQYVGSGNTNIVFRLSLNLLGLKLSLYLVRILYFVVICILIRLHQSKQAHSKTWPDLLICKYTILSICPYYNLKNMSMFSHWFFLYSTILCEMRLWKESLRHQGQQFHRYQQNHVPLKITEYSKDENIYRWKSRYSFVDISGIVDHHCFHKASYCQHKIQE